MRQLLFKLTITFIALFLCSCDRKVCPAYQSAFLIGEGDAEEYFSYFSPYDSLPKDSGIFRGRKKTKNGLVGKKFWPTAWTALSRSEYENRYNFPKVISTKNYVPDTTGMLSEEELLAKEEKTIKKKKPRRKDRKEAEKEEETKSTADTGIIGEGSIEEDLSGNTNTVTPTNPVVDESTGEVIPQPTADSLAKDTTEIVLKFTDQLIYELMFGDPTEKIASDSTSTDENEEAEKKGLFGRKRKKKKKKDRKKNSIVNSTDNKKNNDEATKEEDGSNN